jgi:hypothetical protein
MARAKPKWGFRMDHDAPEALEDIAGKIKAKRAQIAEIVAEIKELKKESEQWTERLKIICQKAEFPISDHGMKELARIMGSFNANRAHEPLKNRPKTRDVVKTLNVLADAWCEAKKVTEEIDDVTGRHLSDLFELLDATAFDCGILASHARHKADKLQEVLDERTGSREKPSDYTLRYFIGDLAIFYEKHTGRKPSARFQRAKYDIEKNLAGKPRGGKVTSPFVRFTYLTVTAIEPKHRFKRNFGELVRDVLRRRHAVA